MSEFILKIADVLNKHKAEDGTYDLDAAQTEFQTQINGFMAKNKPDLEAIKTESANAATAGLFKEFGIEGVTDITSFKDHYTSITSQDSAKEIEKINNDHAKVIGEWETKYGTLETSHKELTNKSLIRDNDFNPKYSNGILAEINSRKTDDKKMEDIIKEVSEAFPEWKTTQPKGNKTPGNRSRFKGKEDDGNQKPGKSWNRFNRH